jgi:IstB-like ATP binding protein
MTRVAALAAAVPGPTITSGVVSNDYSVHPTAVGRRIEIVAGLDWARCSAGAQWWLTIPGAGGLSPVDCRYCPCPSRDCAAARPVDRGRHPAATEVEQRSGAAPAGDAAPLTGYDSAFRMGLDQGMGGGLMPTRTQRHTGQGPDGRGRLPDPGVEGAPCANRWTGSPNGARAKSWTHEENLVACLEREVAAPAAHDDEGRMSSAGLPARKSLEELDLDHACSLTRDMVPRPGTLDFVTAKEDVVFLGPPGTGIRPTWPSG